MNRPPVFPIEYVLKHFGAELPPRRGGWQQMRCILHGEDRRPSASVNYQSGRYHCFTCLSKSEDAIGVVMQHEGCSYREAIGFCENITGVSSGELRKESARKPGLSSLFE